MRAFASVSTLLAVSLAVAGAAQAATVPVSCSGSSSALTAAVADANSTATLDTIEITGGPCTFSLPDAMVSNASGNSSGLSVTEPLTINGNGSTIERSASASAPFRVILNTAPLTLTDVTVQRGSLTGNNVGAGVASFLADLTLDNVTINGNSAAGTSSAGGGIWIQGGVLTVEQSTISFNTAGVAAGIDAIQASGVIRQSSIFGNGAATSAGAVWLQGGRLRFENDTIAGNTAANAVGGLVASNLGAVDGTIDIASTTLRDNRRAGAAAPAIVFHRFQQAGSGTQTINVTDSIVTDSSTAAGAAACASSVVDGGGNLEWPGTTCGFATHADPKLDPVPAKNGGRTFNYKLLPGSPAVGLGGATCPAIDQRGAARPDGAACDAGAVEAPDPDTTATGPTGPTARPRVTFSSPDTPGATFECRANTGSFSACTSPYEPTLSDGTHTVMVRAISEGFADATPASVTFVVDTAPPVITLTTPRAAAQYERGSTVLADFACDDPGATCAGAVAVGDRIDTSTLGPHHFTVRSEDEAANTATRTVSYEVVDATDPTATIATPADGASYTRGASVAAAFTCADEDGGSGIATCTGTVADGELIDTATLGVHDFTVTAVDRAGNTASRTVSYEVVDGTAPTVTLTTPAAGATYTPGQVVHAAFHCADEAGGSGMKSCVGTVPNGAAIDTTASGAQTFQVTATDRAGHVTTTTATYFVAITSVGLCTLTRQAVQSGAKFRALPARQRAAAEGAWSAACKVLEQLRPRRNPLLRANTIKVYAMVVRALVQGRWITAPQGATLNDHAGRL